MKKIICDKCKREIRDSRTVLCQEGWLFLREGKIAHSQVDLCIECKERLGLIIREYVDTVIEYKKDGSHRELTEQDAKKVRELFRYLDSAPNS